MDGGVLLEDRKNGILSLTLNRPQVRNALDRELVERLLAALRGAGTSPEVRAVLLTGAPPSFSSGGDLRWMQERRGNAAATKSVQETHFGALARGLLTLEKPVVAAVNGDAFGAGLMLACACDFVVAAPSARFGAPFVRVALIPDTGATWLLPRLVGLRAARRLTLMGDAIEAAEAAALGLVDAVQADCVARAWEIAEKAAQGPTAAMGLAKRALLRGAEASFDEALANEANLQALCFVLDDHAEGVDAFLEKRPPRFQGR
jgi:2-(1,2-epoxy-1,2-dihydrophenyl)acetyl-CoA isomerase